MKNHKILIPLFLIVALVQIYVPAKMILNREDIIESGVEYHFKTAPIDPTDLFRGKYITLNYDADEFVIHDEKDWDSKDLVFVHLGVDEDGYAKINTVSTNRPDEDINFVEGVVRYVNRSDTEVKLLIDYPFDRYYMEEGKAPKAENMYRKVQRDSTQVAYAVVNIKKGEAVLTDVKINQVSIKDFVQEEDNE